jgi:hypothetical protein
MQELPPQSRISCRLEGQTLAITIPGPSVNAGGNWGIIAIFAFLAVSCTTQGLLTGERGWTLVGLVSALIAGWQLYAMRGAASHAAKAVKLEISPEFISLVTGPSNAPMRQRWAKADVADLRTEASAGSASAELLLQLRNGQPAISLVSTSDPAELNWISEQIHRKWNLSVGQPSK